MKRFLIKILTFVSVIFFIAAVFWLKNGSRLYANSFLNEKVKFVESHPEFNTVFIGSSKINNQINPQIIDSINPNLKSYNLGANGSFNLENFATIDYLLQQENTSIKTMVLELQDKIDFTATNVSSERSFSAVTPQNLMFLMKYHFENLDIKQMLLSGYSAFLNILKMDRSSKKNQVQQIEYINQNGFIPLEKDANPSVKKRHRDLLKNPKEIIARLDDFEKDYKKYKMNSAFVEQLNKINDQAKKKGIRFILLIPAPAEPDAKRLLVYEKLKNIQVLDFLDPKKYPEFYQLENRWDYGHLNQKGSNLLSERVGLSLKIDLVR